MGVIILAYIYKTYNIYYHNAVNVFKLIINKNIVKYDLLIYQISKKIVPKLTLFIIFSFYDC